MEKKHSFNEIFRDILKDFMNHEVERLKTEPHNLNERITLYHGTTSENLNSIITNGILPRKKLEEGKSPTWKGVLSSVDDVVYLTNSWQWQYGAIRKSNILKEDNTPEMFTHPFSLFPVVIEVSVPVSHLLIDEDLAYSPLAKELYYEKVSVAMASGSEHVEIQIPEGGYNYKDSLSQNGTCSFVGRIPPDWITGIHYTPNPITQQELLQEEFSPRDKKKYPALNAFFEMMNSQGTHGKKWGKEMEKFMKAAGYEKIDLNQLKRINGRGDIEFAYAIRGLALEKGKVVVRRMDLNEYFQKSSPLDKREVLKEVEDRGRTMKSFETKGVIDRIEKLEW